MATGDTPGTASGLVFATLGLTITVGGLVLGAVARGFPELPGGYPGPGLFPLIIAGLFVVFGLTLTVQAVPGLRARADALSRADAGVVSQADEAAVASANGADAGATSADVDAAGAATAADGDEALSGFDRTRPVAALLNIGAVLVGVVVFMALDAVIGFLVAMTVVIGGLMMTLGRRLRTAVPVAVVVSCAVWYVFGTVLRVPLSPGPWGW